MYWNKLAIPDNLVVENAYMRFLIMVILLLMQEFVCSVLDCNHFLTLGLDFFLFW
jgi:hypothetical protein